ncbi:MAG: MFS transporter [Alphaproteobacteria bacterium]|nr:MFS transporter [Alphaproteobacteria bacterium]
MIKMDVKKHESLIGALGNVMEWYDFALVMPMFVVLRGQFFPNDASEWVKVLGGLIVSMGLFTRPLGAFIFGPIGDKFGRQKAISISILLMAIPTVLMGILPGYDQIGVWAPILFMFLRILQGISMGGEYTAAMVHIVEKAPSNRRGFYGSWTDFGNQVGVLFAGQSVVWLHSFFSESGVYSFAWRIPFICGVLLVPFAFLIPKQEKKDADSQKKSILKMLIEHKKEVFCTVAITAFSAVSFYTLWTFLPYYLVSAGILSLKEAAFCGAAASIVSMVSILGAGYLSDIFNRKLFLSIGMIGVLFSSVYTFFSQASSYHFWLIMQLIMGFFLGVYYSCRAAFFAEAFPKEVRCTAVSVSLSVAQAVFGGLTPVVMVWLVGGSPYLAILPVAAVSIWALFSLGLLEDRTGKEFI